VLPCDTTVDLCTFDDNRYRSCEDQINIVVFAALDDDRIALSRFKENTFGGEGIGNMEVPSDKFLAQNCLS